MPYRAYGKCTTCDKWMTKLEAEESQWGNEFPDELMCDGCFELVFGEAADQYAAQQLEAAALANTFAPINELIANANELYKNTEV